MYWDYSLYYVYRWHNSQWLEMVENRSVEDDMGASYAPDQDIDPYVQGTEALDRPEYMFAGTQASQLALFNELLVNIYLTTC